MANLLARAWANLGDAEAMRWCDRALAADRLNPSLHHLRGTILQEAGVTSVDEGDLVAVDKQIRLSPDEPHRMHVW